MGLKAVPRNFHLHELPPSCQDSILVHGHRAGVLSLSDLQQAARTQSANNHAEKMQSHKTYIKIMSPHRVKSRDIIGTIGLKQTHPDKNKLVDPGLNQRFRHRKELLLENKNGAANYMSELEWLILETEATEAMRDECKAAWSYINFFENRAKNQ